MLNIHAQASMFDMVLNTPFDVPRLGGFDMMY